MCLVFYQKAVSVYYSKSNAEKINSSYNYRFDYRRWRTSVLDILEKCRKENSTFWNLQDNYRSRSHGR